MNSLMDIRRRCLDISQRTERWLIPIAVVLIASYWALTAAASALNARVADQYLAAPFTIPIAGLRLNYTVGLDQQPPLRARSSSPERRWSLVVVLADSCRACTEHSSQLRSFVRDSVNLIPALQVQLISTDSGQLAAGLAGDLGRDHVNLWTVANARLFRRNTGVTATPTIFLLDPDDRVRVLAAGFNERRATTILAAIRTLFLGSEAHSAVNQ